MNEADVILAVHWFVHNIQPAELGAGGAVVLGIAGIIAFFTMKN